MAQKCYIIYFCCRDTLRKSIRRTSGISIGHYFKKKTVGEPHLLHKGGFIEKVTIPDIIAVSH